MSNWLGIETTLPLRPTGDESERLCANQLDLMKSEPMGSPRYTQRVEAAGQCMNRVDDMFISANARQQSLIDGVVLSGTLAVPLVLALIFRKQIRRAIEGAVVDTGAAAIRSKRSASGYLGGLKARMDEKAKEDRQD